ncbi:MAG: TetR/AcrR family transcriptional regulator [Chitinophagales bacterium]|nr:TetR/AcrR family transcriptional regulator [Chitinophagales bacterium]
MPKQKVSIDFILRQSLRLFREKSYHNTSIADIAEACGLLKGSLYHYFPSKEALMNEVVKYAHAYFKKNVFSIAHNQELTAQEKMEQIFKKSEKSLLSHGDLMANVGVETANKNKEFTENIQTFFEEWIETVKIVFSEIANEEDAQQLAEQTVLEFEGAVMMTRIFKDPKFVHNAYERLINRFAAFSLNPNK